MANPDLVFGSNSCGFNKGRQKGDTVLKLN